MSTEPIAEIARLRAENDALMAAIQDIDAHATPIGLADNDDPDGNPHHYALTVGALHRALGKAGTAPKCPQQYERAQVLQVERDAWKAHATHLESRLFDIWVLTERPARKCNGLDHDDVCTVAELADAPAGPDMPAEPPAAPVGGEQHG